VDTRSRMCHGGWEVWVHRVSAIIYISELIIVIIVVVTQIYNSRIPMYPHLPTSMVHTRSRVHLNSYLPTVYNSY